MVDKSKYIDMAGLTPIVRGLRLNATKPGQLGTELTASEALYLDAVTTGDGTAASKALVSDSSGQIGLARKYVADAAFASPVALTAAQSGGLCVFDNAAGAIFTLPAAAAGLYYDFVIVTSASSNGHRVNCTTGDFMLGSIMIHATDDTGLSSAYAANGTTHLGIFLDAATTGWLAGGKFRLTAISATQWVIEGDLLGTGTIATPFETT
jgi:hypothetical protein